MINRTKFPEWRRYQLDEDRGYTIIISRLEIDDWFKRCLADAPDYFWGNENIVQDHERNPGHRADMCLKYLAWREMWFSQFIEDSEDGDK